MYVITRKQTRPSLEINFFDVRNENLVKKEYRDYWRTTYIHTSKCLYVQRSLSDDELELISVQLWDTKQDHIDFMNDNYAKEEFINKFTEYNKSNNISFQIVSEEEI